MFTLEGVSLRYGGVRAVNDVSLTFETGARVALIGPNGAGKSSLLSLMGGQTRSTSGLIRLGERDITTLGPYRRANLGITRSFQITNLMEGLTAREQAELACMTPGRRGWVRARGNQDSKQRAESLLADWGVPERTWDVRPESLSYGQQRSLELALAMARSPKVLLLDEPNVGLTGQENTALVRRIAGLDPKITVVLVAHDMDMVFGFAERVIVMARGKVAVDGSPEEVRKNQLVADIYFGTGGEASK
ncbi:MAG: ATP-binding cassette domain-containing protein [Intrasporangium sp.]|uniref:ABC transporter ATP-binding protein n=1 Tax=Intrasporangium sp. TaxID=1925024 RepID=UPI002648CA52|nr:ATP-binding cassette domain-containing protein [Intrasporangium sp.]MDN5794132.1 ATP-binding cassette domain-containing protein [Intrasporangium sp.]